MQSSHIKSQFYKGSVVMKPSFRLLFPSTTLVSALLVIGLSNAQAAVELPEQSPIDITSLNTTFNPNLAPLNFNLSSDTPLKRNK